MPCSKHSVKVKAMLRLMIQKTFLSSAEQTDIREITTSGCLGKMYPHLSLACGHAVDFTIARHFDCDSSNLKRLAGTGRGFHLQSEGC